MTNERVVIGLVGASGSGKDTVAEYLREKYDVQLMRFADPLKETLSIYFDKFSKDDQQWLAEEFIHRFGPDILPRALRKRIDEGQGVLAVNGIRLWEDFHFIKSYTNSFIIYIKLDQKTRFERIKSRGEKTDDNKLTFEEFQKTEEVKTEKDVPEIGEKADFIIENDKDLEHLLSEVDNVMEKIS